MDSPAIIDFFKEKEFAFCLFTFAYCPAIIDITCKDADFPALLDF